ncbi:MAG: DsbA family protein [Gammaproteobacteria bacterium]|jgi:putative protein-disulfide isomerase
MTATLHYIFDPLCGWCYAAEPLVQAAAGNPELAVTLHGGGLWPEPTTLPDDMRNYISQADSRLAQISGQPLGDAYRNKLLSDPDLILDSRPTIRAVLAADSLTDEGLAMLQAIQRAHYVEGRHVVREAVLSALAADLGLDRAGFSKAFETTDVDTHIGQTRNLMQRIGARGFPTFVLEVDGQWLGVDHNRFQRNAAGFASWLESVVEKTAKAASAG